MALYALFVLAALINFGKGEFLTDKRTCVEKLISGNDKIPDSAFTASSFKPGLEPAKARLESASAWEPDIVGHHIHYIQVNLQKPKEVSGVVVMSHAKIAKAIPLFYIATSLDGVHFEYIRFHQNGGRMHFKGPGGDPNWEQPRFFGNTLIAQYVRIYPFGNQNLLSLRFDVLGCNGKSIEINQALKKPLRCKRPLGMESGAIEDSQLTASSTEGINSHPWFARLNYIGESGLDSSWCPLPRTTNQWLQVDFRKNTQVTGILVQGRETHQQFVKTFRIQYGDNGSTWKDLGKTFQGTNWLSVQRIIFDKPFTGRFVRFIPVTWNTSGIIPCVRLEFIGCSKRKKPTGGKPGKPNGGKPGKPGKSADE